MCGICGKYNFLSGVPAKPSDIEDMMNTIVHRGPDDSGMHMAGPLGLGFRRLSIIDLSAGHQPMSDQSESVWVVFNGEIYNFKELRQELEAHGHIFRTNCDTEVIVHGYKQWGDAVLERFNGMFGLAIWDVTRRRLVLARDPMGIKQLYFSLNNEGLCFGSEIRPVRAALSPSPGVDIEAIGLFLRYRYTPAPRTIYSGVQKLAAGEKLVVENGKATVSRYYRFEPTPFAPKPAVDEAAEKLLELYKAAVKRHLISDVPLGLLLSGGMDSGMLLGLMSLYGKDWPTFTVGYGSSFRDDELDDAAQTARIYGSRHYSVRLDRHMFDEAFPRIVDSLEEPVASSSIVPMYFVCQRAREIVKVALIGQGPDELFGGYKRHLGVKYGSAWRSMPRWLQGLGSSIARTLPRNETLKRGVQSLGDNDQLHRFQQVFSIVADGTLDSLFKAELLPSASDRSTDSSWGAYRSAMGRLDELNAFQLLELRSSLPDELLMYGDKLSMAHALEVRVPYLDREVVEYSQQLDSSFKVRHGVRKWLHRRVCSEFLPQEILRRKKRGFAVNVVDDWFRDSFQGRIGDYLADGQSLIYGYLRHDTVTELVHRHSTGRQDHHKILFSLVVLEQWLRANSSPAEAIR
jgi:asparagine synthase (glutamine-hydrolysing)